MVTVETSKYIIMCIELVRESSQSRFYLKAEATRNRTQFSLSNVGQHSKNVLLYNNILFIN